MERIIKEDEIFYIEFETTHWWFGWHTRWNRVQTTECSYNPPEVWEEDRSFFTLKEAEDYIDKWMTKKEVKIVKTY